MRRLELAQPDYAWKLTLAATVLAGFGFVAFRMVRPHFWDPLAYLGTPNLASCTNSNHPRVDSTRPITSHDYSWFWTTPSIHYFCFITILRIDFTFMMYTLICNNIHATKKCKRLSVGMGSTGKVAFNVHRGCDGAPRHHSLATQKRANTKMRPKTTPPPTPLQPKVFDKLSLPY